MANLVTLQATYRIVTPMFLGGADPNNCAELRPPSIKGALRFWYRAIDPDYRDQEAKIFGGTGKDEGQAVFLLGVSNKKLHFGEKGDGSWINTKTAYLGYGPIARGLTTRCYIKSGSTFTLNCHFHPRSTENQRHKVMNALWALVMFGGMGARSRKGFGSIVVEQACGMESAGLPSLQPKNITELKEALRGFCSGLPAMPRLPRYTALGRYARCIVAGEGETGEEALKWFGQKMWEGRSWESRSKFPWVKSDHDGMRAFIEKRTEPPAPIYRSAFGLPHNYFFSSLDNQKASVDFIADDRTSRRASPLLIHIHEFPGETKACVVATFLPARLIPKGSKLRISCNGSTVERKPPDFKAVKDFLDCLAKSGEELS